MSRRSSPLELGDISLEDTDKDKYSRNFLKLPRDVLRNISNRITFKLYKIDQGIHHLWYLIPTNLSKSNPTHDDIYKSAERNDAPFYKIYSGFKHFKDIDNKMIKKEYILYIRNYNNRHEFHNFKLDEHPAEKFILIEQLEGKTLIITEDIKDVGHHMHNILNMKIEKKGGKKKSLDDLTVKELQERCIKRKIKYSGMRKAELIAALRN